MPEKVVNMQHVRKNESTARRRRADRPLHNRSHKTRPRKEAPTHPPPHATNQIVNKLFQIKLSQSTSSIDLLFKLPPPPFPPLFFHSNPPPHQLVPHT